MTPTMTRGRAPIASIVFAPMVSDYLRALLITETAGDKVSLMNAHVALAKLLVQQGDFEQALVQLTSEEPLINSTNNPSLRVQLLRTRFAAHLRTGNFEQALADNRELMPILRAKEDHDGQAETFLGSAWGFQSLGNIPRAIGCYESGLTEFQNSQNKDGQVRAQIGLGSLYQSIGRLDKASRTVSGSNAQCLQATTGHDLR